MSKKQKYENPFNPYTCSIQGDLSRADVVALTLLCRGKDVVEYGVGGSTIILSQIAKSVTSFDTKEIWVERTKEFLKKVPNKTCEPEFRPILEEKHNGSSVKGLGFPCDIVFSDGWAALRGFFILEFWRYMNECAITHDSRAIYASNIVKMFMNNYDSNHKNDPEFPWGINPYLSTLKKIEWNYLESNCCVFFKRNTSLIWEDWKKTEENNNRNDYGKW